MTAYLKRQLSGFSATYRRELGAYFATPMAYVFLAVFLLALGLFTWEAGRFFDTGVADLQPFFVWHPWLYMIFLPALAMRLWADERASGTDELLLSLPVGLPGLVLGKLLAAWTVAAAGLVLVGRARIGDFTVGTPRDKQILSADYTRGGFNANLRVTRYGELTQRNSVNPRQDETVSPTGIVDLDLSYDITEDIRVSIGANNLLDTYPDIVQPANRGGTNPFTYFNQYSPFGITGGFYYTRLNWKF